MHWGDRQVTTTTESSAPKKREMESLKESLNPKGQGWKFLYEVSRPGNNSHSFTLWALGSAF